MATTGAVGGSQIDVQGLVSQLIAAERAPMDRQVARESGRVTTQVSAVGTLMGALSTFRSALSSLKTTDVFSTRQAVSGDEAIFTATAGAKAVPGDYQVEVVQLARAQQLSSNAFAEGAAQRIGTGTLELSLGENRFSLAIDDTNATLADIRDAINAAADNPGIRATLVHGTDGSRLVLSSTATGAGNLIEVAHSGGDGGLQALTYSAAADSNYTQISAAQDAIVNIANAEVRSATNRIENAIDGVVLDLKGESQEGPTRLGVNYDSAAVQTRINTFVNAYNALMTQVSRLRSYDSITQTAGPMLGDSLLSSIESQLRRAISEPVAEAGSTYPTLAAVGILTQADGKLAVDDAKLQLALSGDFTAVGKLFGAEDGVAARLFAQADERLKDGGALDARSKALVEQQKDIQERKDNIELRIAARQRAYLLQFTRLDTLLSQLQVTSSYLSQQVESLGNLNRSASK